MRFLNKILWKRWIAHKRRNSNIPLPLERLNKASVKNILVISCTALGDTLLSTPALRATSKAFPDAHISWLVKQPYTQLFSSNPHADEIIAYHGSYRRTFDLVKKFRKRNFDLCISLHDSDPCPVQAAWLAGVPFILRSGWKDQELVPFLSARTPPREDSHNIEKRLEVIRLIDRSKVESIHDYHKMIMPVDNEKRKNFWDSLSKEYNLASTDNVFYIGFQISASKPYTVWPPENFAQLASKTVSKFPTATVFLLGGPEDYKLGNRIKHMANAGNRIVNLGGKTEINNLHLVIDGLDLLVTNDTGPMHLAIAVHTPVIALFVPSILQYTGPYQDLDTHTVIHKKRPCEPCARKYCKKPYCMSSISVKEVFEAVTSKFKNDEMLHLSS